MRVYVDKFEITGEDFEEQVHALTIDGGGSIQVTELFRSDYPAFDHRGNNMVTVQFTVSKLHEQEADAFEWALMRAQNVPKSGTVKFVMQGDGKVRVRTMAGAVVEAVGVPEIIGVSTVATYRIKGGRIV